MGADPSTRRPGATPHRAYAFLLRVLPTAFRQRYEADLHDLFDAQRTEPRYRGPTGAVLFWIDILKDLVHTRVRLRRSSASAIQPASSLETSDRMRSQPDGGFRDPRPALASGQNHTQPDGGFRGPRPALASGQHHQTMDAMLQDLRYTFRSLAKRPGFTAIAILSLALGIGGNSLIFALVDGLVLHPFSYPDAGRFVTVGTRFPKLNAPLTFIEHMAPAEYVDLRSAHTLQKLVAFDLGNRNVSGGDVPERVFAAFVWGDPFDPVGLRPLHGRGFTMEETTGRADPVAIISHRLWQQRFGGDPRLVGQIIRVNGQPATLVGIMPRELLILGTDLWLPMGVDPAVFPRNRRQFAVLARLAPGATLAAANTELTALAARIDGQYRQEFKEYEGWQLVAVPWAEALTGEMRPVAFVLLGAVGFVLLIACANLANLVLARASERQREMAVRLALGAGRGRLVRQVLGESVTLALLGAMAGLVLTVAGLRVVPSLLPAELTALEPALGMNGRVLFFSATIAVMSGLLVGLWPAWQAATSDPQESLKGDSRTASSGRATRRMRSALVVAEVALALVLLVGAGLFIRTALHIYAIDAGFNAERVLTLRITLPNERYKGAQLGAFFRQLVDRVSPQPGVRAVAAGSQFPPMAGMRSQFQVDQSSPSTTAALPRALQTIVSREWFATLGQRLVSGRTFTEGDRRDTPPTVVVNQSFARRYFGDVNAVGRRIKIGGAASNEPWGEIVGIVFDTRNRGLMAEPEPEIYDLMERTNFMNQLFILVRTDGDPMASLAMVRRELKALDPELPVYYVRTLEQAIATSLLQQRLAVVLLSLFAGLALALAAIGVYGVLSYAVSTRTQEIGIRMALGAARPDVVRLVVGQALRLVGVGLVVGLALSIVLGRAMRTLLFGVSPTDPMTLVTVAVILTAVALLAGYLPARRASRVDPVRALRYE